MLHHRLSEPPNGINRRVVADNSLGHEQQDEGCRGEVFSSYPLADDAKSLPRILRAYVLPCSIFRKYPRKCSVSFLSTRILLLVLLTLLLSGCGGSTAPEPPATSQAATGQELFNRQFGCNSCHPGGRRSTGPALVGAEFQARHPTNDTIQRQVRNGGGGMPAYGPERMSDLELQAVIAYIRWLNTHPPEQGALRSIGDR